MATLLVIKKPSVMSTCLVARWVLSNEVGTELPCLC